MKYSPHDDDVIGGRRAGRPPFQADTKYRQQQRSEILEDLDDDEDADHPVTPQKPQYRNP